MKLDDASHRQTLLSSSIQMMDVRMKRVEDMLETVVSNIQETQTLVYRIFDSVSPISTNNQRFPSTSEPLKAVDIVVTDHSVEQISHFPHPLSGILYEDSVSHLSIPSEETQSTSANVESVRKRSSSELIGTDRQKVALRPVRGRVLRSSTAERSIKSAMVTASDGSDYGSPSHAVLERKRAKFYFSSSPQTERRHPDGTYPYTESPRGSPVSGEDDKKQKETAERRSSLPTSPDFKRSLRGQMLSVPLVSRHQSLTPRSPVYGEKMRPRIQEYTTITDNIDTTGVLSPDSDQQQYVAKECGSIIKFQSKFNQKCLF